MSRRSTSFSDPEKLLQHIFTHRRLNTIVPGTLTVSCYANFFPVCYHHKQTGKIVGLDVDIMRYFCRISRLKLVLVERKNFDGIWFDPLNGVSDIAIGGIGITNLRTRPGMSWSIPYFYVHRTLVYNRSNPIHRFPQDISGTVRATVGSTGWLDAQSRLANTGKQHLLEPGKADQKDISDLLEGKIQGLFRGSFVGKSLIQRHKSLGMVRPWSMDSDMVAIDGEVFAYPTLCSSGVGQMISVFLTEEIFKGELMHLVKRYKLD